MTDIHAMQLSSETLSLFQAVIPPLLSALMDWSELEWNGACMHHDAGHDWLEAVVMLGSTKYGLPFRHLPTRRSLTETLAEPPLRGFLSGACFSHLSPWSAAFSHLSPWSAACEMTDTFKQWRNNAPVGALPPWCVTPAIRGPIKWRSTLKNTIYDVLQSKKDWQVSKTGCCCCRYHDWQVSKTGCCCCRYHDAVTINDRWWWRCSAGVMSLRISKPLGSSAQRPPMAQTAPKMCCTYV